MSINLDDILNQVRQVEDAKTEIEKGGFKTDPRLLTMKKNCTYVIRMVPTVKNFDGTFVTWKEISWKSQVDGKYIYGGRSPSDAGLKVDPYKSAQWETYSTAKAKGDEAAMKSSYKLLPSRKQVVNAYLVSVEGDDDASRSKVGTVVVLKYSASVDKTGAPISDIYNRIYNALFGDNVKKIGTRAIDLSEKGKSLIIKVTEKAGFSNYSNTIFDDAEDLGLSEAKIKEIYANTHDLSEFIPEVKPTEEIMKLLHNHWYGHDASTDAELTEAESPKVRMHADVNDEIPGLSSNKTQEVDLDQLLADD
jgi:hypothetical protein